MKFLSGCHLHPDFKAKRLEVGSEGGDVLVSVAGVGRTHLSLQTFLPLGLMIQPQVL